MLDSLVTIKQQRTRVIKTKEFVHISLWTTLIMPFLRKFVMTSREQLDDVNAFFIHC